jgi:serine/threonine-protein phosphatase 5
MDRTYLGPKLPQNEDGKYGINLEFIQGMLEWFKVGKALPRRSVLHTIAPPWSALLKIKY